jgi:hypothetical protein
MRITAQEVMEKRALMPGAGQQSRPLGPAQAPQALEPQPGAGDPAAAGGQPAADPAQKAQGGNQDLQGITQKLLNDYFDDQKIADVSHQVQQLIPLVGPEHAEKFVKVFSDWIKAAQVLKANLMAMVVMATPAKMMENQMSQMMNQLMKGQPGQQGPQPLTAPIT